MTSTVETIEQPGFVHNNIIDFIRDRELSWRRNISPESSYMLKEDLREIVCSKMPYVMRKELVRYPQENKCDKIFASKWISTDTVCFGTKDNQLLLWKYSTGNITSIPLPDAPLSASPMPVGEPATSPDPSAAQLPISGIHDIDTNSSITRLVSGGKSDHDMALFELPYMRPSAILQGHQDCVFTSKFISDDILLSGGRDGALMLWNISSSSMDEGIKVIRPTECLMKSPFRIRNIQHGKYTDRAFVLCGDCSLAVFDCRTMIQVQRSPLPEEADLVCLAVSEENGIVAAGCQSGTMLMDMRTGNVVSEISDIGLPYGVRSLAFNRDILTIGGGNGEVDFYDIRMLSHRLSKPLLCSKGSMRPTQFYPDIIPCDAPQAVYTLAYDPEYANKLFVAGGPLICGLKGSYASVWA